MAAQPVEEPRNHHPRRQRRRGGQPSSRRQQTIDVPAGHLAVGKIINAHGLRGEVSIEPYTDFPDERFAPGQSVLLGEEMESAEIATSRPHLGRTLVRFSHIDNRDEAEALRGVWVLIPEAHAIELEEDTYFIHQIVGLTVQTAAGQVLGTVQDVLFTGANEVYIVQPQDGLNRGKELLLPAIAEVVQSVDLEAGVLTVNLLPGLLDEALDENLDEDDEETGEDS
jgi:16S rRNA processing protein RimM